MDPEQTVAVITDPERFVIAVQDRQCRECQFAGRIYYRNANPPTPTETVLQAGVLHFMWDIVYSRTCGGDQTHQIAPVGPHGGL